jgi:hypothetical protein
MSRNLLVRQNLVCCLAKLDKDEKFGMIETYPAILDPVALQYRQPVDLIGCLTLADNQSCL